MINDANNFENLAMTNKDELEATYKVIIGAARQKGLVRYSELITMHKWPEDSATRMMGNQLDALVKVCCRRGWPAMAVIVVRKHYDRLTDNNLAAFVRGSRNAGYTVEDPEDFQDKQRELLYMWAPIAPYSLDLSEQEIQDIFLNTHDQHANDALLIDDNDQDDDNGEANVQPEKSPPRTSEIGAKDLTPYQKKGLSSANNKTKIDQLGDGMETSERDKTGEMIPNVCLNRITIDSFKRISYAHIELKPITTLIGCNASGKSSVLHAAQFGIAILQQVYKGANNKGKHDFRTTLSYTDVLFRPTFDFMELKNGAKITQSSGISITYEGEYKKSGEKITAKCTVIILRGKNANISVRLDGDDAGIELAAILGNKERPASILALGISGIQLQEEWRTRPVIDAAAMHGDANLYLRCVLDHLHKNRSAWNEFRNFLSECFEGVQIFVRYKDTVDRTVDVVVVYEGKEITLDLVALGMLQVIQILAYVFLYRPPMLLLDEPDSHLHADSQLRLCKVLRRIAKDIDTRIIIASHSPQIIQNFSEDPMAKVVWIQSGKVLQGRNKSPDYALLAQLGMLSLGNWISDHSKKLLLFSEDSKLNKISILASSNGAPRNIVIHSYYGRENLYSSYLMAQLILNQRPDIKIIIHRDRDFMTDIELNYQRMVSDSKLKKLNIFERVTEIFSPHNDIEKCFLNIEHLGEIFRGKIEKEEIREIIQEEIQKNNIDLLDKFKDSRRIFERTIYMKSKRDNDMWKVARMPEKPPKTSDIIPNDSRLIPFSYCHGKMLMNIIVTRLEDKLGLRRHHIESMIFQKSKHLIVTDWNDKFS